jgi:hypothetical protein
MGTTGHGWKLKQLSKGPDCIALDKSEIRKVFADEERPSLPNSRRMHHSRTSQYTSAC